MHDDTGPGDHLCQAASGVILVNIALLHAHHVELLDMGVRNHRPVRPREDAAFEQQDPMVVVGREQRLGQHGARDPLGAQARATQGLGLHAAAAGPGIGPPCLP